ncbi:MAG: UDP-N-acetylmuramoyl-tripeptide--D-alanyl-D-alanine ligase [Oscillospiraceae bacterium]|nr:UDP-N-acetylmuramoyl-tripeptide--D-alanyl-D-alanine ligase [Oscillospiraceae bacterium]
MEKLTVKEIMTAVGGKAETETADLTVTDISTDTRDIHPGSLFVPIKGERFDGHDFIGQAFASGAVAVLSERQAEGGCVIRVSDTRKAYLELAGWYRRQLPVTVVGITGSVGKTTTKEMIAAVLESKYNTLKTEGNFNNEIGLPRTLFQLNRDHQMAVIEMGMSHFGEISRLTRAAAPDFGVITNVGVSHIENLGSREGILQAKLELLEGMAQDAPLLLNLDNDMLAKAAETVARKVITYGIDSDRADIRACDIAENGLTTEFDILYEGKKVHALLPTVGKHNVLNALAAFAVGLYHGVEPSLAAEALYHYTPAGMRQRIADRNGVWVIEDCYNASPDSMRAALNVLSGLSCNGRRIAVLADMLELGDYSAEAHTEVGKAVAESQAELLLCTGKDAAHIVAGAKEAGMKNAWFFSDREELADMVKKELRQGDCLLFKASRGMKLEELLEKIFADR